MKTGILTISDSRTKDEDLTGPAIIKMLEKEGYCIADHSVLKDDYEGVKEKLIYYADYMKLDLVLTNGGTGFGPRDITPEATGAVIDKEAPGLAELMRMEGLKKTNRAALSRARSGIRKNTLIVNLPGSPKGATESLNAILPVIPHAIDMIKGKSH